MFSLTAHSSKMRLPQYHCFEKILAVVVRRYRS